jgi:hypothetical protein
VRQRAAVGGEETRDMSGTRAERRAPDERVKQLGPSVKSPTSDDKFKAQLTDTLGRSAVLSFPSHSHSQNRQASLFSTSAHLWQISSPSIR